MTFQSVQRPGPIISPFPNPAPNQTGCGYTILEVGPSPIIGPYNLRLYGSAFASGGVWQNSDSRLKKNITPITSAVEIVKQLNGVTYEFDQDVAPDKYLPVGRTYGFLTQDVKKVMPEIVQDDEAGFDAMKYDAVIPVLTEAIKEQQLSLIHI